MDLTLNHQADGLRLFYPNLSRRHLVDIAAQVNLLGKEHPQEAVTRLVDDALHAAMAHSPSLQRQMGNEQTVEYILLASNKHVKTKIQVLAEYLKQGLVAIGGYTVKLLPVTEEGQRVDPESPAHEDSGHKQHVIYIVYAADGGFEFQNTEFQISRLIYVTVSGQHTPQDKLRQRLPSQLLINEGDDRSDSIKKKDALFGSLVLTVIAEPPDRRVLDMRTEKLDADHLHHRLHRDVTILNSSNKDRCKLPDPPPAVQLERWARNVTNRQVGFTTSGGGACAYRTIAILNTLDAKNMTVDVFGGLSGGAVIGAYLAGDESEGLQEVLGMGKRISRLVPVLMFTTKPMESIVDDDMGYQRVGETSMRFFAVSTEMMQGEPPQATIVTRGTLGQAVRASGSLPMGFAPTVIDGHRYTDGMASAIVPTHVAINHGADVTFACNCVPGPNRTNPFGATAIGRFVYFDTPLGRLIDYSTWVYFLTQNASTAYGQGSDVYFQFNPENIASFEALHWGDAYEILGKAYREEGRIEEAVDRLKEEYWEKMI